MKARKSLKAPAGYTAFTPRDMEPDGVLGAAIALTMNLTSGQEQCETLLNVINVLNDMCHGLDDDYGQTLACLLELRQWGLPDELQLFYFEKGKRHVWCYNYVMLTDYGLMIANRARFAAAGVVFAD